MSIVEAIYSTFFENVYSPQNICIQTVSLTLSKKLLKNTQDKPKKLITGLLSIQWNSESITRNGNDNFQLWKNLYLTSSL